MQPERAPKSDENTIDDLVRLKLASATGIYDWV
jgi:hypothetical protein